jgi:hypothetical protein
VLPQGQQQGQQPQEPSDEDKTVLESLAPAFARNPEEANVLTPETARLVRSAQNAGYSPASDPVKMTEMAQKALVTGDQQTYLRLNENARAELSRLASQGTFIDKNGNNQMVPGWLNLQQASASIGPNTQWLQNQAAAQNSRSIVNSRDHEIQKVLEKYTTGTFPDRLADLDRLARFLNVNTKNFANLNGAQQSNEILRKEAADSGVRLRQLNLQGSTDYQTSLQQKTQVDPSNAPESNQLILAQNKATKIYENMYLKAALEQINKNPNTSFNQAQFASTWESNHPNLLSELINQQKLTTPVRGVEPPNKPSENAQYVIEPGKFESNGKRNQNPIVVSYVNGKPQFVRSVE